MPNDLVHLNVGGHRFSTSKRTLLSGLPNEETFFTSLLSGRIASNVDETGAYFIDRDPTLFKQILNYMRTQQLHLLIEDNPNPKQLSALIHEAKFYGILPLVKQLSLCQSVGKSSCGNILFCGKLEPPKSPESRPVKLIKAHYSTIVVAYDTFFACYQHKGVTGYQHVFTSSELAPDDVIEDIAINVKMGLSIEGQAVQKIVAVAHGNKVTIIGYVTGKEVSCGTFSLPTHVTHVFFVGYDLIALSLNYVGVWRAQQWQSQRVATITSYDVIGSFLFIGAHNGSIYYIDMEKFPLRMIDNDLLVSELFKDPSTPSVAITALSVYLPTKTKSCFQGNSIEIAYGTSTGLVRLIVQYPETVGQGPQLYQTFSMHTTPIVDIFLSDKYLVSTCANQHVRTWTVTRFRGMISTYPGSTVLASYTLIDLDYKSSESESEANEMNTKPKLRTNGGGAEDEALFLQKLTTTEVLLRQASNGDRLAEIHSVDESAFVAFCEHDENSTTRSSSGTSNLLFSGHDNGVIQIWDLQTAGVMFKKNSGGQDLQQQSNLQSYEMAKLLDSTRRLEL